MTKVIDTNQQTTSQIVHLLADDVTSVIRYISPINPSGTKTVKAPEAKALAANGIRLGLVNEGWGDFAHGGVSAGAGERDGQFCIQYLPTIGAPTGACVFFAVDTDASQAQIAKLVIPYFKAIAIAFAGTGYRVGVYGSGDVCRAVIEAKLAELAWLSCSLGWLGSRTYLAAMPKELVLRQHVPATIANMDCDPDDAFGDFGDFMPFAPTPAPPAPSSPPSPVVVAAAAPDLPDGFMERLAAFLKVEMQSA